MTENGLTRYVRNKMDFKPIQIRHIERNGNCKNRYLKSRKYNGDYDIWTEFDIQENDFMICNQ